MLLIVKGQPTKAICRECRKLHSAAKCPKRKRKGYQVSESTRRQREFMSLAVAVQEDLRAFREARNA